MGVTEGAVGTTAAGVTGAGLAEVPSDGGAGLLAAGLERATCCSMSFTCDRGYNSVGNCHGKRRCQGAPAGPSRLTHENHSLVLTDRTSTPSFPD